MIRAHFELLRPYSLVDARQELSVHVRAVVDAPEVPDELVHRHPLLRLQVRRMKICVQKDDGERQDEDRVQRLQFTKI